MSEVAPTETVVETPAPAPNAVAAAAAAPAPETTPAPAPAEEPAPSLMGGGGEPAVVDNAVAAAEQYTKWDMDRASLPDDLNTLPWVKDSKSFEEMVRSNNQLQIGLGSDKIIKPNLEDAADVSRFWSELGRPETADAYDLSGFTPPEGIGWSDDLTNRMLVHMHGLGLTQDQVAGTVAAMAQEQSADIGDAVGTLIEQHDAREVALKEEFGTAFENLLHNGQAMGRNMIGNEAFEALIHTKTASGGEMGNEPGFAELLMNIASKVSPDSPIIGTAGKANAVAATPDGAQAERDKLMADPINRAAFYEGTGPPALVNTIIEQMQQTYNNQYGDQQLDE